MAATFTAEPLADTLDFWAAQFATPIDLKFVPYNQVFQQLLNPHSAFSQNADGANVIVLALEDWSAERLSAMGVAVLLLADDSRVKEWLASGPVHGVYWLPALDSEGSLDDMDLARWREALRVRVKSLYATMRALYEQEAFLVSAVRLDAPWSVLGPIASVLAYVALQRWVVPLEGREPVNP